MPAKRPKPKPKKKPKESAAAQHKRFLDVAREVEASDDPKDFDKAFGRVTGRPGRGA
ncbi:MAG TPA: hypothetical protein VGG10_15220 [Rhizomicrobium sp.]|jgi:hypothetical protein